MKAQWISASIAFSMVTGLSLSSCAPIQSMFGGGANVIQDELEEMALTLPAGWSPDSRLNDGAGIQAANEGEDLYIIVLAEERAALLGDYTLEDNSDVYRSLLIENLENFEEQSQTEVTSIDGNAARQYEIRGVTEGVEVIYLHTTVATDTRYYQVVAWTTPEQYDRYESELREVVESFQEI